MSNIFSSLSGNSWIESLLDDLRASFGDQLDPRILHLFFGIDSSGTTVEVPKFPPLPSIYELMGIEPPVEVALPPSPIEKILAEFLDAALAAATTVPDTGADATGGTFDTDPLALLSDLFALPAAVETTGPSDDFLKAILDMLPPGFGGVSVGSATTVDDFVFPEKVEPAVLLEDVMQAAGLEARPHNSVPDLTPDHTDDAASLVGFDGHHPFADDFIF